jgi:hypothetical protein
MEFAVPELPLFERAFAPDLPRFIRRTYSLFSSAPLRLLSGSMTSKSTKESEKAVDFRLPRSLDWKKYFKMINNATFSFTNDVAEVSHFRSPHDHFLTRVLHSQIVVSLCVCVRVSCNDDAACLSNVVRANIPWICSCILPALDCNHDRSLLCARCCAK